MEADLYLWKAPRDLAPDAAEALVASWQAAGGEPADSPFQPNTDVGWAFRELTHDLPDVEAVSDAPRDASSRPIWLSTDDAPPARVIAVRVSSDRQEELLSEILGLATKYDLVVFDRRHGRVAQPLEALEAHASATFWPGGAIRAVLIGVAGSIAAAVAWSMGIALVSGIVAIVGVFLAVLSVATIVHEVRVARRRD